jgi:hypothetical protein
MGNNTRARFTDFAMNVLANFVAIGLVYITGVVLGVVHVSRASKAVLAATAVTVLVSGVAFWIVTDVTEANNARNRTVFGLVFLLLLLGFVGLGLYTNTYIAWWEAALLAFAAYIVGGIVGAVLSFVFS